MKILNYNYRIIIKWSRCILTKIQCSHLSYLKILSKYLKTLFYLNMTMWLCSITYFIIFSGISYLSVSFHVILLSANYIIMIVKFFNTSFVVHTHRLHHNSVVFYWIKSNYHRLTIKIFLRVACAPLYLYIFYFISCHRIWQVIFIPLHTKRSIKCICNCSIGLITKRHIYTITINSYKVTLIKIHTWKCIYKPSYISTLSLGNKRPLTLGE